MLLALHEAVAASLEGSHVFIPGMAKFSQLEVHISKTASGTQQTHRLTFRLHGCATLCACVCAGQPDAHQQVRHATAGDCGAGGRGGDHSQGYSSHVPTAPAVCAGTGSS